ncbi:N-acetyltransferase [Rugosimonospora africana]|uniref:N-acetyltransferase n=1 Tax=Rugosimonospora africana TaxID=556532 RepID=A0A8J3VSE5_9ACTN|nr:N-acetyltransferase [Rugosimonospora africana]
MRSIDAANRAAVEDLQVSTAQRRFVEAVADSLAEAEAQAHRPWCRAFYVGQTPVGFVMLADNDPTCLWPYYLWRFLIDARYQGRGYGRSAMDLVAAHVAARPRAADLVTSVACYDDPEIGRHSPLGFYLAYGFEETGERNGLEIVIRLNLASRRWSTA